MPDPLAHDGRTTDQVARLARWLSYLCWLTVLLPVGLTCVFGPSGPHWAEVAFYAAIASAVLLVVFSVPAVLYRVAAGAVGRRRTWGAAVIIAVATLHAGGAGWALYLFLRRLLWEKSMGGLLPVLIAQLAAVTSLVVVVAAVVHAYQAIGAIRRLANADGPLGFAPVMPTPVMPAPPFGELRPGVDPGLDHIRVGPAGERGR